jgi:hypothetical protein
LSYNLAPKNAPWFEHLTDSVRALGEAALEWQHAARDAALGYARADVQRRLMHDGTVTGQPGPNARGWEATPSERSPHIDALFDVQRLYSDLQLRTHNEYEHQALLFASGAAWAVRQVRAGATPSRVELPLAEDRRALVPAGFDADLGALEDDRYSELRRVTAAHQQLMECLNAAEFGQEISEQDYIADHEASEMHECAAIAQGTADAAYRFGLLIEQSLRFVLLPAKATHRKQRAAQDEQTGGPAS